MPAQLPGRGAYNHALSSLKIGIMEFVNLPLIFLVGCALIALLAKKNGYSWYLFFFAVAVPAPLLLLALPYVLSVEAASLTSVRLGAALLFPLAGLLLALRRKQ